MAWRVGKQSPASMPDNDGKNIPWGKFVHPIALGRSTVRHLRYIEREGVDRQGGPGRVYGSLTDEADSDGALYQVYAAVGRVTVISLQPGEELVTVAAGDTVRWIVGDTSSGSAADLRVNVLVKPIRSDLKTNLVITTSRRTYLLELTSTEKTWMASVSWDYAAPDASGQYRCAH